MLKEVKVLLGYD